VLQEYSKEVDNKTYFLWEEKTFVFDSKSTDDCTTDQAKFTISESKDLQKKHISFIGKQLEERKNRN
jgi:predicted sulfurtransferase